MSTYIFKVDLDVITTMNYYVEADSEEEALELLRAEYYEDYEIMTEKINSKSKPVLLEVLDDES